MPSWGAFTGRSVVQLAGIGSSWRQPAGRGLAAGGAVSCSPLSVASRVSSGSGFPVLRVEHADVDIGCLVNALGRLECGLRQTRKGEFQVSELVLDHIAVGPACGCWFRGGPGRHGVNEFLDEVTADPVEFDAAFGLGVSACSGEIEDKSGAREIEAVPGVEMFQQPVRLACRIGVHDPVTDSAFEVVPEEGRQFQVLDGPVRPVDAEAARVEIVTDTALRSRAWPAARTVQMVPHGCLGQIYFSRPGTSLTTAASGPGSIVIRRVTSAGIRRVHDRYITIPQQVHDWLNQIQSLREDTGNPLAGMTPPLAKRPDPPTTSPATAPFQSSTRRRAIRTRSPPPWQPRWDGAGRC